MNDDDFVRSILLAPQDAALRLVYADWLEERGDPRAAYLRAQAACDALPADSPDRPVAEARIGEIEPRMRLAWLAKVDAPRAWSRLQQLNARVREPEHFAEAQAVASQTMERVRDNVEILVKRLLEAGYQFERPDYAHVLPTADAPRLIAEVEQAIGPMPLSLRAFYEVVGSVDFCQSPKQLVSWSNPRRKTATEVELLGEEDPLCVWSLRQLHGLVMPGGQRGGEINAFLYQFADDEYHKACYSGGEGYHVTLPNPGADFVILGMCIDPVGERSESFVTYLRNACLGGGFRGRMPDEEMRRPPDTALIRQFREGLWAV